METNLEKIVVQSPEHAVHLDGDDMFRNLFPHMFSSNKDAQAIDYAKWLDQQSEQFRKLASSQGWKTIGDVITRPISGDFCKTESEIKFESLQVWHGDKLSSLSSNADNAMEAIVEKETTLQKGSHRPLRRASYLERVRCLFSQTHYGRVATKTTPIEFLRFWELFRFILPSKTRREIYEPLYEEFKEDYLIARKRYKTKSAGRWLNFCFVCKTAIMVVGCIRAMLGSKIISLLLKFVPESIRRLFSS